MKEKEVLNQLQTGNMDILKKIYLEYKTPFYNYAKGFSISKNEILDIYQDVILAFQENVRTGKVTKLESSIKTYLFSIGKYMIYNRVKKLNKLRLVDNFNDKDEKLVLEHNFLFEQELNNNQKKIKYGFSLLGEKCKEILTLFYYRGFSLDEITSYLNYKNKDVTKSQKNRCLKSLKDKMK